MHDVEIFSLSTAPKSDPVARKLRLRRRRDGQESEKVLKVNFLKLSGVFN